MQFFKEKFFFFIYSVVMLVAPGINANPVWYLSSEKFHHIIETPYFMDRSLLIETILKDSPYLYITGPTGSGKTVNLNMLRHFLEIPVTPEGEVIKELKKTKNYKLFVQNNLRITRKTETMRKHFGKYPIIRVSWYIDPLCENMAQILEGCTLAISNAFGEHKYLENSTKLPDGDKKIYRIWKNENLSRCFNESSVQEGLHLLSRLLYLHYNTKSIILVDELDSFTIAQMCGYEPEIKHWQYTAELFWKALHGSETKFVERAIFTGISPVFINPVLERNTIATRSFVRDEKYVKYFGFMPIEMYDLFIRFNTTEQEQNQIHHFYKAFTFRDMDFYRTYSIAWYLKRRKFGTFWKETTTFWKIFSAFRNRKIRAAIESLARNNTVAIKYMKCTKENIDQMNYLIKHCAKTEFYDLWFSVVLDHGFFEIVSEKNIEPDGSIEMQIKILNSEKIKQFICFQLLKYYKILKEKDKFFEIHELMGKVDIKSHDYYV